MQKNKFKALFAVLGTSLIMGAISFMVTLKVYDEKYSNEDLKNSNEKEIIQNNEKEKNTEKYVAKNNNKTIENIDSNEIIKKPENIITNEAVSTSEEYLGDEIDVVEISETEYLAFIKENFTNEINAEDNVETSKIDVGIDEKDVIATIANVENKKIEFKMPIEGEIGMDFSTEKLVYSNTLEEWTTHTGIDILAEEAMPVKAIADGVVESIKMDPRYGNTVIIKHNDEYTSIYSNLSTTDLVFVGKKVKMGEIISGVGKGFGFESKEEPHVHLEVLKNGEYLNPNDIF